MARIFLTNHGEYLRMIGMSEVPSFQTLPRMLDLHAINREIAFLYYIEEIAAVDSFMIHTCKYSTAVRRKYWGNTKIQNQDGPGPSCGDRMAGNAK